MEKGVGAGVGAAGVGAGAGGGGRAPGTFGVALRLPRDGAQESGFSRELGAQLQALAAAEGRLEARRPPAL